MKSKFLLLVFVFIHSFCWAKTVDVEVKGKVDIDDFACQKTISPIVLQVCYLEEKKYLLVNIKDVWSQHCEVEPEMVKELVSSSSVSRVFNEKIKGNFSCYH